MSLPSEAPRTFLDALWYFSDPDECLALMASLRWPDGLECPRCGSREYSFLTTRRLWKCKDCKRQYSVKAGLILEDSPIGLDAWLGAIWLIANSTDGISSREMAQSLSIKQKTARFILHRIRLAMQTDSFPAPLPAEPTTQRMLNSMSKEDSNRSVHEDDDDDTYDDLSEFLMLARRIVRVPKKEIMDARPDESIASD